MRDRRPPITHRQSTIADRRAITEAARQYITGSATDPQLTLGEVAAHVRVSARSLQRAFLSCDTSFHQERAQARWRCALRLLRAEYSVSATARWCGYESVSHFVSAFHARYGVTPGHFLAVMKLDNRCIKRRFKAKAYPVSSQSREYRSRYRRQNADVRELRALIAALPPAARAAMTEVHRPERTVYGVDAPWPIREPQARRPLTEDEFDAYFERNLGMSEEEYWLAEEHYYREQQNAAAAAEDWMSLLQP